MIGDDVPVQGVIVGERPRHRSLNSLHSWGEQRDVVVGLRPLQDGSCALQSHPRIDVLLLQRDERTILLGVVLHEHEVPDLGESVAIAGYALAIRAACPLLSRIEEDLRVRAARAGLPYRSPPVVFLAQTDDPLLWDADLIMPDGERFVILLEHGDPQTTRRDTKLHGQELPGVLNRLVLEVIAEGEVAQHLKERVVIRCPPDVLDVRRAEALLIRCHARKTRSYVPPENILELHHPRCGEQERRIVWY